MPDAPPRSLLSRNRAFARLWWAATISNFGSMLHAIALPFLAVMLLDVAPAEMAGLAAAGVVPGVVLGLVAGAWVDRLPRRPILVATDWGRALVVATVPLAAALGTLRLEHLYAAALLNGLLGFGFDVAHTAYVPFLVRRDELVEANASLRAAESVTEGAAFALGGWLIELIGGALVLAGDAVSFLLSAAFLRGIPVEEAPRAARTGGGSIAREIGEGVRFTARQPLLLPLVGSAALGAFSFRVAGVVYLLYVYRELGFAPGVLGMVFAVGAVSSFAGALVAGRASQKIGVGPSMIAGLALLGGAILLLPIAPAAGAIALAILVTHQCGDGFEVVYAINQTSLRQAVTPDPMLGRVSASLHFAEAVASLLGIAVGGVLGEVLGLRATLTVSGAACLVGALWLLLSPVRSVERLPSASAS